MGSPRSASQPSMGWFAPSRVHQERDSPPLALFGSSDGGARWRSDGLERTGARSRHVGDSGHGAMGESGTDDGVSRAFPFLPVHEKARRGRADSC